MSEQTLPTLRADEGLASERHSLPGRRPSRLDRWKPVIERTFRWAGLWSLGIRNACDLQLSKIDLCLKGLPQELDGFTILHLTDLHIDRDGELADRAAGIAAAHEVDLCAVTGDYRFGPRWTPHQTHANLETVLGSVNTRIGTFGVLGNHDTLEDRDILESFGVQVLMNKKADIITSGTRFNLIGVDDPSTGRSALSAATDGTAKNDFSILLAHSPEIYQDPAMPLIDLCLCGHTHGGQIGLPGRIPILKGCTAPRRYASGMWHHGPTTGFTSRGIGSSCLPIRFFCPPEVVHITLHAQH